MKDIERVTVIVLDSAGVGELPDAKDFGDEGSNTFGHIAEAVDGISLPNMQKMGLGNLTNIKGVDPLVETNGAYGKAKEASKGKDTTTGHWEIGGVILEKPFPTYPNGFPKEVIEEFEKRTGRKVLANKPSSGTVILDEYGEEQMKTGAFIVYTSADPVFQIAAHEEIIPLQELYNACKIALEICNEMSPVARVIARPYVGEGKGKFTRTSNRHDYSIAPPKETILDKVKAAGLDVIAIGKTSDIFSGKGVTDSRGTNKDNKDGILKTIKALKEDTKGLIFTNLVDFDMVYGHRRNPEGYANALIEFDNYLPEIIENMKEKEVLIITADHGCDPTYKGTDHTREYIPILVYGKGVKSVNIGERETFADIAATIEEILLNKEVEGSFAKEILE
ncbi:phosphopentomutase [Hypnocyclicus thermotrophus]|uniref:Phosphopentomutase n=1 Tax=Hypnocyclicus thermotrophus TaxID=1627895 RepID=A0AA46E187_9FUSO|nr:phosphopentomutase [Hypnocyclicus thermotrophus]TDT72468.1 phosphopentomutase [Hypnocyclicus thermotrophus]